MPIIEIDFIKSVFFIKFLLDYRPHATTFTRPIYSLDYANHNILLSPMTLVSIILL